MPKETIALISLGCAKNLVNSEQMLCLLSDAGYTLVSDCDGADVAIVNTCAFIESAKSEAIDEILALASLKAAGRLGYIIVTGCLSERYQKEIPVELPEVDALVGVGSFGEIVSVVEETLRKGKSARFGDKNGPLDEVGRVLSTGPGWAYLKIADGCDNHCAFCIIPAIRGRYRSRPMENILAEARALADSGVHELIIIAQDITRYGRDLYGSYKLAQLCRELSEIPGITWLRLHYLYPDIIDDALIDEIAQNDKICKYLDIPIQHISDPILRRMHRRGSSAEIQALFQKLRARIPGLVLRTSLITGLPGEDEAAFEQLCDFLRQAKIERVGVFPYSPEEDTPAALMTDRCSQEEAERRADLILDLQERIMDDWAAGFIGQDLQVLCTGSDGAYLTGRSYADSPDIDGTVYFTGDCPVGAFTTVHITGLMDGELTGEEVARN